MGSKTINPEMGQIFSRFTVVGEPIRVGRSLYIPVRCNCGKETLVMKQNLERGKSRSCGCLNIEELKSRFKKYPEGSRKTYNIWAAMLNRCHSEDNLHYKNYGGRGITVCERWNDFLNFYEDMGKAPKDLTLDRLNNELGYSKENCAWVSRHDNMMNRRNTVKVKYQGQTLTLAELSELCSVPRANLYKRLFIERRSVEDSVKPVKFKSKNGEAVWNKKH